MADCEGPFLQINLNLETLRIEIIFVVLRVVCHELYGC